MSDLHDLLAELEELAVPDEVDKVRRFFKGGDPKTKVMGIQIGKVFPVAKKYANLDLTEVESLLEDVRYEVRMAAVAIMDFQARNKKLSTVDRADLFALYMRRHDRINNWDLVDRAAPQVVGEYLVDRDRTVLDELANSPDPHRRRTAIVATHALLKRGQVNDTFRIAGILARDKDDYVQKAIASWTREAGKTDAAALIEYLEKYKTSLPKPTITAASKSLPEAIRKRLRS